MDRFDSISIAFVRRWIIRNICPRIDLTSELDAAMHMAKNLNGRSALRRSASVLGGMATNGKTGMRRDWYILRSSLAGRDRRGTSPESARQMHLGRAWRFQVWGMCTVVMPSPFEAAGQGSCDGSPEMGIIRIYFVCDGTLKSSIHLPCCPPRLRAEFGLCPRLAFWPWISPEALRRSTSPFRRPSS